ncbi:MAG: hypothetical protein IPJ14_09550 [Kineosporiaceae bacterium]|nr:hypothetical protein [Kineosporiaceae bacterium]MBK7622891.1 hypothetical protein [Kineosporiaceae bacterium]
MLTTLLLTLLVTCLVAPWLGQDTSDARAERARPPQGWYPTLPERRY